MCAHYQNETRISIFDRYGPKWASPSLSEAQSEMFPRYTGTVLRWRKGELGLDAMMWTLVPFWAETGDPKKFKANFNARSESLDTVASFKAPFLYRRCLVPATWFMEYPSLGGRKVAHRVAGAGGEDLVFAGLWDRWKASDGSAELLSFTIVTADPHPELRWLHHRLPVVLTPAAAEAWLDPDTSPARAKELLTSPTPEMLAASVADLPEKVQVESSQGDFFSKREGKGEG